ncbi:MAG: FkbM family methyltransferase [Sterolibacterium sp.]|nr:FkbM family methyltransferase [Sterolibacterium sp.]MBP9799982.1 FkbM family methyltransferase [Sterolibacterium sp.]
MRFEWIFHRLVDRLSGCSVEEGRRSYSQCGEDLIVRFVFDTLRIPAPSYLDIGAHHPHYLNNTFQFYAAGGRGVNIEPDPQLIAGFTEKRPRDVNLNIGIGDSTGILEFFVMNVRTLNTFSSTEARQLEASGKFRIEQVLPIPVRSVNDVLAEHFGRSAPDFISLDVEGLDLQILRSLDFARWRPKVLCVETITYSDRGAGEKIPEIAALLQEQGYFPFADTYVNTIFVDRSVWQRA